VRRAFRSASRLGGNLELLWVRRPGQSLTEDQERSLRALRELASVLGVNLLVEDSDDVAATVADVVNRRGITYILMGRARPARGLARLRAPLHDRIIEQVPGVDVRIVADRARRLTQETP
jgi:two-component system sensor histidine kinase KdpD